MQAIRTQMAVATACLAACLLLPVAASAQGTNSNERPNFVVIVADDLGFSDLGSFGGEIKTPNIDQLASEGRRFTEYTVSISCSPTRAMLLTGRDNHVVGLGNMYERTAPNQMDRPGYEGVLTREHRTIAEVLSDQGYRTYMAGKWHLGHAPEAIPAARGFDRSFSMLNAAGSHFDWTGNRTENEVSEFVEDDTYLTQLPRGYYSTKTFTDKIIDYIEEGRPSGEPFFAYVAHQAPHDPLQVPDRWLRRYKGAYDHGWDDARARRFERMKELGILGEDATLAPRLWFVPEWDNLTGIAQSTVARKMEIYAAMVDYLDHEVGRLIQYLETSGLADNTYVLFFSDNGPESSDPIPNAKDRPSSAAANFFATNYRTDFASWGRKGSYVAYGQRGLKSRPRPSTCSRARSTKRHQVTTDHQGTRNRPARLYRSRGRPSRQRRRTDPARAGRPRDVLALRKPTNDGAARPFVGTAARVGLQASRLGRAQLRDGDVGRSSLPSRCLEGRLDAQALRDRRLAALQRRRRPS